MPSKSSSPPLRPPRAHLFWASRPTELAMSSGCVHLKGQAPDSGVPFQEILKLGNLASANGEGKTGGYGSDTDGKNFSSHSFGAQFVEVEWDPGICHLRVSRVVSVIDAGRIINAKTAPTRWPELSSWVLVWACSRAPPMILAMAIPSTTTSPTMLSQRLPTHPDIDVTFLDIPDPMIGEYGARGIGEIGLAGIAPAITAAVYHATGVRVRDLPIRIEDLIVAKGDA